MRDTVLWIIALICFLAGAWGTLRADPKLVAIGWLGFVAAAVTFIS